MKTKFLMSAVLVLTLLLAACAPRAAAATKRATVPTPIPPTTKATTVPTKSANTTSSTNPKATPTPGSASTSSKSITPTLGPALINDISINDQSVKSGSVLVSLVDSLKPGWVAIFTDQNGQPGTLLGYTAVPAGTSSDVKVTIDAKQATNQMIAMLLLDAGKIGTFEYPGADEPVKNANVNTTVMATFNRIGATSQ
ncbi:MAG TPA: hypothetical protein VK206_18330 [Anaerolineales bacterium]|nr:hypothetical protein [Anaerolineales bacterium]